MANQPAEVLTQLRVQDEEWTLVVTIKDGLLLFEMEETGDPSSGGGHVSVKADEFVEALQRLLGR